MNGPRLVIIGLLSALSLQPLAAQIGSRVVDSVNVASITGLGTGVATALGIAVGSAGGPVVNSAASTPSFKVTLTSNQSVTTATWTKILFDTVIYDVGSYWSTGNKNYNPQVAGTYMFCLIANATATFTLGNDNFDTSISKNGLAGGAGTRTGTMANSVATGTLQPSNSSCTLVAMNGSTDTVEFDALVTGTNPVVGGGATFITTASGYRIGP